MAVARALVALGLVAHAHRSATRDLRGHSAHVGASALPRPPPWFRLMRPAPTPPSARGALYATFRLFSQAIREQCNGRPYLGREGRSAAWAQAAVSAIVGLRLSTPAPAATRSPVPREGAGTGPFHRWRLENEGRIHLVRRFSFQITRWFSAGVLVGSLLTGTAVAAGYDVAANCTLAPLRFLFSGQQVTPQVANGNPSGFICHGSSYVPLRFMAQALAQQVAWEGSTDTVSVAPLPTLGAAAVASGTAVTVTFSVHNFQLVAPGGLVVAGQGHIHVWLDGQDLQMVWTPTATFTKVAPGVHTVTAELVDSQHQPITPVVRASVAVTVPATGGTSPTGTSSTSTNPMWG